MIVSNEPDARLRVLRTRPRWEVTTLLTEPGLSIVNTPPRHCTTIPALVEDVAERLFAPPAQGDITAPREAVGHDHFQDIHDTELLHNAASDSSDPCVVQLHRMILTISGKFDPGFYPIL